MNAREKYRHATVHPALGFTRCFCLRQELTMHDTCLCSHLYHTLVPHNTVFQAETLAIKEAINWANSKEISTSSWSDSESALRAISSFKSSNSLIQQALLQNPSMQLNWIKAHVAFLGNEAADNLANQATEEGTQLHLQAPKCHLNK
ncbi:hypothetical protein AVEN_93190-1 [Araneus ventricosus]|uniref:RNase H type-1 domain-containing protein n=1 Tax=Araneus ventricosus TaxID=182803 RepID=A0A4Y2K2R6_ARAVE|nr:hypothetical protein AVEN_93190-1 [Araneus ventricosus]